MTRQEHKTPQAGFTQNLWLSFALVVTLILVFVLYVWSEKRLDRANEQRYLSRVLAGELRQSSDDLTRMIRSYAVTLDPVYKQYYQDILDIRNGTKPRPDKYENIYWDFVTAGIKSYQEQGTSVALLEMMKRTGFTEEEFLKLAEAKLNSDALTATEFESMRLIDTAEPLHNEAVLEKARMMLFDKNYHQQKGAIMKPIDEFFTLMDNRTKEGVAFAEHRAIVLRYVFALLGLTLIFLRWRTYGLLLKLLGGSVNEVYLKISKIGSGDFSSRITAPQGLEDSVMGRLSKTQNRLEQLDSQNKSANSNLDYAYSKINAVVANAMDGIISIHADGRIESFNPAAERIFGYKADELIGKNISLLMPEPYRSEHDGHIKNYLRTGQRKVIGVVREIPAVRKNSEVFDLEISVCETILENQHLFTGIVRDITERKRLETELRENKQRMNVALHTLAGGAWEWNLVTDEVKYSPRWLESCGYSPGDLEPHVNSWKQLIHPDDIARIGEHLRAYFSGETPIYGIEYRLRANSGDWLWRRTQGTPISWDANGKPTYMIGADVDITERKIAETLLKENEAKLRATINASPVPMALNDEQQNITFLNPAFVEILGYTLKDIPTLKDWWPKAYPDPKYRQWVIDTWQATIEKAKQESMPFLPLELNIRCADGATRTVMASAATIEKSFAGNHLVVLYDITERKRIEEELKQHRNHLQELVDQKTQALRETNAALVRALREEEAIYASNPDILYVADTQARVTKWNRKMEEVTGYSPDELMGKLCVSFFPPEESDPVAQAIQRVFTEGKAEVEAHLLTKSGNLILYHFNGIPLKNENNETIGFTGTGRDISERKRAEETLQQTQRQLLHAEKLSSLGKLTGAIAHEFNNPIYGMRLLLEEIEDEAALNEAHKNNLSLAIRECDRIANLIKQLQGFYRPSSQVKVETSINQIVEDMLLLTQKKMKGKSITLEKKLDANLPKLKVVEDQIKQVVLNMIQNAEESISSAEGQIIISTQNGEGEILIRFQDNGTGIPDEISGKIFEPFFTTKSAVKGTGLGLSVSHGIIADHGGRIQVESKPGEGSVFTLILPKT